MVHIDQNYPYRPEIGAVLSYRIDYPLITNLTGQQVGVDLSGNYCTVLYGNPLDCEEQGRRLLIDLEKAFKLSAVLLVRQVNDYYGNPRIDEVSVESADETF